MPPLSISEFRDVLAVLGMLASLLAAGVAGYCGIIHGLNGIRKDLKLFAGQTTRDLKAQDRRVTEQDRRVTELERRVRDLQARMSHSPRRRDTASD